MENNTKALLFKRMNSIGGMPLNEEIITKEDLKRIVNDLEPLNDSEYFNELNQTTYKDYLNNPKGFETYEQYLNSFNDESPADNAKEEQDDDYYEIKLHDMAEKYKLIAEIIDGNNNIPAWIQDKLSVSYHNANAIFDYYRAIEKERNENIN